jgi:uncharacterized protein
MVHPSSFSTRAFRGDDEQVLALAEAAGIHGVYVRNALELGEGHGFGMLRQGALRGLCWFGPRGNLIVLQDGDLDPVAVADAVQRTRLSWRIAMGPAAILDVLRERMVVRPLLHRDQVYYACRPVEACRELVREDVRPAQRADRDRLAQATLQLNHSDLKIDPARVDRRWLRDSIDERIGNGSTRVLGPIGSPDCKLDFGSEGPGGLMIEGVFTFPPARGRGLASALVASCIAAATHERVCLHVGEHNLPARAAYERAGMVAVDRCRLLLLA